MTLQIQITTQQIWEALEDVKDPEIPVVSLVELGIVREVELIGDRAVVTIAPTFVGCPALIPMREAIVERVKLLGVHEVEVKTSLNPPWTTEWMSASARAKLQSIGFAPPPHHTGAIDLVLLEPATCPRCGGSDTVLDNLFGPTPCRSLYYCHTCRQSFEQFKPM
ncbi:MAG TPA: 1,2-phenylacetyl-CoA epoxidase subunit PaaD [Anaerolineae bacterium]|nr:1,2-phenylacetyl-CoA epoxidase subunit PaaD [Anaerolineae bacterium]